MGTVNGGVWRTTSAFDDPDSLVHWEPVLDGQPVRCSSISALTTGLSAGRPEVIMAGCGPSTSSEQGSDWNVANSGPWGGVMYSLDNGVTWAMHEGMPVNHYVTALELLASDAGDLTVVAAARSSYYDREDGGVWRGSLADAAAPWAIVLQSPVFQLAASGDTVLAALPYNTTATFMRSLDGGKTFDSWSEGIHWELTVLGKITKMQPFYPTVVFSADGTTAFAGALTVDPSSPTTTASALFWRTASGSDSWTKINGGPISLDDDSMPKDRMAILPDPEVSDIIYVVGNGDKLAWRVDYAANDWTSLTGDDTADSREPHCDCRNLAFHTSTGSQGGSYTERLILVSDGGIFARDGPRSAGGVWRSLNGDIRAMEYVDAHYDGKEGRWIAGAQDNDVQISETGANPEAVAHGVIMGDGTVTAIDTNMSPTRLFGCRQFLGQAQDDQRRRRHRRRLGVTDDDDALDAEGLRFIQGDVAVDIPILDHFDDERSFPFFIQSFVTNKYAMEAGYDGTLLTFWANSSLNGNQAAGFYQYSLPQGLNHSGDVNPPLLLAAAAEDVYVVAAGGVVVGSNGSSVADPGLLVGLSSDVLLFKSAALSGSDEVFRRPLPVKFAEPLNMPYNPLTGAQIVAPVSHGRTVSLAIAPHDASTIAVTGWPESIESNGDVDGTPAEVILVSRDAGVTWDNVFGDLTAVTATPARVRPSGLLLIPLAIGDVALLTGTVSGVYVSYLSAPGTWARFGSCSDLPLVYVMNLSYDEHSDTVVAATMGRGVYTLTGAKNFLTETSGALLAERGV